MSSVVKEHSFPHLGSNKVNADCRNRPPCHFKLGVKQRRQMVRQESRENLVVEARRDQQSLPMLESNLHMRVPRHLGQDRPFRRKGKVLGIHLRKPHNIQGKHQHLVRDFRRLHRRLQQEQAYQIGIAHTYKPLRGPKNICTHLLHTRCVDFSVAEPV